MHQAKLRVTQVFELAKMKGSLSLQKAPLSKSTELCSHPKPPYGHQIAHTDHHCTSEKQPAKADHSIKCSLFEYEIVYSCTILFMMKIEPAKLGDKTNKFNAQSSTGLLLQKT